MGARHGRITRRYVQIDFTSAGADGWSRSSRRFENGLNALSFLFPAGERYFINSVRNYMDRITDPVLKEQARRFIYQEAMHAKEHARANQVLKQVHPYGSEMERLAGSLLALGRRLMPKSTQLANSCAIEHLTAILADALLRDQKTVRSEYEPAFAALWLWHAVEETEHKAVCFDVYQYVCGKGFFSYLHRVGIMVATSLSFLFVMAVGFSLIKWKQKRRRFAAAASGRAGKASPQATTAPTIATFLKLISWRLYFDYYRRSFHPWDHDNGHLIDEWKQYYARFGERPAAAAGAETGFNTPMMACGTPADNS